MVRTQRPAARSNSTRWVVLLLAVIALVVASYRAYRWSTRPEVVEMREAARDARGRPPTVVFVVLDAVRADHTSLCGYGRPTTPTLEELREAGASWTCSAVAPGSWTLPSHASFFTGASPLEHGAHFVSGNEHGVLNSFRSTPDGTDIAARPLGPELETLAESFSAVGYQTLAVSANPVVSSFTGLLRGFEVQDAASYLGWYHGEALAGRVALALRDLDRARPLFLFVNINDAHQPWSAIPDGLGWVPASPRRASRLPEYFALHGPAAQADFLEKQQDSYDYGIRRADDNLRALLALLDTTGWLAGDYRIVVTSDHGEFLGEHGMVDHGRYLYEANQQVFLMALGLDDSIQWPGIQAANHAYELVRYGEMPSAMQDVFAVAWPDRYLREVTGGALGGHTSVAIWRGREKFVWMDDDIWRIDLSADPGENQRQPLDEELLAQRLAELGAQARAAGEARGTIDPAVIELLRAAGYAQ